MYYLYAVISGLLLVYIFLILQKRNRGPADYWLIGVNISLGLFLLSDVLVQWELNSFALLFQNSVPLLLLPVFVFYAMQYTQSQQSISNKWYGLFVPLALMVSYSIFDHFVWHSYSQEEILNAYNSPNMMYQVMFKGSQILFMGVLFNLLRDLKKFHFRLKAGYSSTEEMDVKWLANFTRIYLGTICVTFILFISQNLGVISFSVKEVYAIIYGILVLAILVMIYQGIKHFTVDQLVEESSKVMLETTVIPSTEKEIPIPVLTPKEVDFETQMLRLIEDQGLFLTPTLSLKDLATELNQSTHFVSRIINAKENRSFYDLINGYRVDHLKGLMQDPKNQKFTILALGLDSGFNSKASLNRIFKKQTGLTPKQFLEQELADK